MPPKAPKTFKTPDGKEFNTRAEWRDYMVSTFYSFKNKVDVEEPLVKNPGDISGQGFDIADCSNSTLVVADHCEQVQIDCCTNCRIFIGACTSSIFIRNCDNCVFYTCCRQLRLREVTNSVFYIYSMSEVHIEETNTVQFAPFDGGYPAHAEHLKTANLDPAYNLWYDIFDHNDPGKTHENWSLLPEDEYESGWFPLGEEMEVACAKTAVGSVVKIEEEGGMTGFNADQLRSMNTSTSHAAAVEAPSAAAPSPPKSAAAASSGGAPVPPPAPPAPPVPVAAAAPPPSEAEALRVQLSAIVADCVAYQPGQIKSWAADTFVQVATTDVTGTPQTLSKVTSFSIGPSADVAWVGYTSVSTASPDQSFNGSCVLKRTEVSGVECGFVQSTAVWTVCLDHRSKA